MGAGHTPPYRSKYRIREISMTTLNDIYRITAHMNLGGSIDVENVYYLKVGTAGSDTDSDVLTACAAWMDDCYTWISGDLWDSLTFVDVRGFNVTRDVPLAPVAWPVLVSGTSGNDLVATGVSLVITFYTLVSRVRGRKFLGGLTESGIGDSIWSPTQLTHAVNFGIEVLAGPPALSGGTTLEWGIYRKNKPFLSVSRFVASAVPGYQRRRRLNVGS